MNRWMLLVGFLVCLPVAATDVVRLRNPDYQASLSNLHEADQALTRAIAKVRDSRQQPIANIDYQRLLADLRAVEGELAKALAPHRHADKHRVIKPDAMYFQAPGLTQEPEPRKP